MTSMQRITGKKEYMETQAVLWLFEMLQVLSWFSGQNKGAPLFLTHSLYTVLLKDRVTTIPLRADAKDDALHLTAVIVFI